MHKLCSPLWFEFNFCNFFEYFFAKLIAKFFQRGHNLTNDQIFYLKKVVTCEVIRILVRPDQNSRASVNKLNDNPYPAAVKISISCKHIIDPIIRSNALNIPVFRLELLG